MVSDLQLTDNRGNGRARDPDMLGERLARGLGWASLGLGASTIATPRAIARLIGVQDGDRSKLLMRGAVGAREIAAGVGILRQRGRVGWLWARVAGDLLDLAMLRAAYVAYSGDSDRRRRVARTTVAIAGITAADVIATVKLSRSGSSSTGEGNMRGTAATTIRRPIDEVYHFWHDFENLPRFMEHLESVKNIGGGRSQWRAEAPTGMVEWEAEITADAVNERIAWRSVEGADIDNTGSVRFARAPAGQGTEVFVELEYALPAGKLGATVAKLFGQEPGQQIRDDLRRFKQVMETGEVVRSEGSPGGMSAKVQLEQRPAQPVSA